MYKHSMKLFLASSAFAVAVASVSVPIQAEAATKTFKDISKDHVYYKEISEMASKGIINGYEDGTFKPNQKISRKHAAALLARAFPNEEKSPSRKLPKDVKVGHPYYNDIALAVQSGLIHNDSKGNFNPDLEMDRGAMAAAIYNAYGLSELGYSSTIIKFKDIQDERLARFTSTLYDAGITTGYEDGTFKPNEGLSRAHYTVFLYRASKALESKKGVIEQKEKDKLDWGIRSTPRLSSQQAMKDADAEHILLAGRESNSGKYDDIRSTGRVPYSEENFKGYLKLKDIL